MEEPVNLNTTPLPLIKEAIKDLPTVPSKNEGAQDHDISVERFMQEFGNDQIMPPETFFKLDKPYQVNDSTYNRKIKLFAMAWDRNEDGELSIYGVGLYYAVGATSIAFLKSQDDIHGHWKTVAKTKWMDRWLNQNYSKIITRNPGDGSPRDDRISNKVLNLE